jgi:hypothetical protein
MDLLIRPGAGDHPTLVPCLPAAVKRSRLVRQRAAEPTAVALEVRPALG